MFLDAATRPTGKSVVVLAMRGSREAVGGGGDFQGLITPILLKKKKK